MKAIFRLFFSENNKFFIIGGTKYLYIIIYLSYVGIISKRELNTYVGIV